MKRTLVAIAIVATAALAISACGSSGSSSTKSTKATTSSTKAASSVPEIQQANGFYFAEVKDEAAAKAVCKQQHELGLQLKKVPTTTTPNPALSSPNNFPDTSGIKIIELRYGPQTPTQVNVALSAGDVAVVSPTLTLCAVQVP